MSEPQNVQQADERVTALITKLQAPANIELGNFTDWLVKLIISGAQFPGFWSGEIIPPKHAERKEWTLVQWYSNSLDCYVDY